MRTDPAIEERNEILELRKLLKKVHHEAAEGLQQPNIMLIQKNHQSINMFWDAFYTELKRKCKPDWTGFILQRYIWTDGYILSKCEDSKWGQTPKNILWAEQQKK